MKTTVILRRCMLGLFFILNLIMVVPQQAAADTFDDMIWVLNKVEKVSGPVFSGVSIQDIQSSKEYVNCLVNASNDIAVAVCTDSFHDTPLGQQAVSGAGIPSWFWDLLDLYVDLRTGDLWGAVEHLGKAALCIVAQYFSGGTDVCGLIEELVELGEDLLNAATAVGEFLADVGGAIADGAAAVGCAVGIGDCEKSTPPEVRVYQWVFAPKIHDAVAAKKQVDATAYTVLFNQLKTNALHKPAIYSIASQTITIGGMTMTVPPVVNFSEKAVNIAAGSFDKAVDANWTSAVVTTALGDLSTQRNTFNNPNLLRFLVSSATTDFEALQRTTPNLRIEQKLPGLIIDRCTKEFSETRKFAHVDRWITSHQAQAAQLGNPKTNRDWCTQLWEQNKQSFIPALRQYANDHFCQGMSCTTITKYQSCVALMGLVGQQATCTPTNQVGREAAGKISADFTIRGSLIPCSIRNDSKGISPATAELVCSRPTQGHECSATYQRLFPALPVKLVNCIVEERPDYTAQKNSFYATVKTLQLSKRFAINIGQIDPLVAHIDASKEELLAALQQTAATGGAVESNRGEAAQRAQNLRFEYQQRSTVDGENSPLYIRTRGGVIAVGSQSSGNAQNATHTPVGGFQSPAQTGGANVGPGFNQQGNFTNPGNQAMQNSGIHNNAANQAAQQGGAASQQAQARAMAPPAPSKPDLMVTPQVSVGNSTTLWGSTITLTSQQVQAAGNGLCSTTITYTVKNAGTAAAPVFTSMLLSSSATNRPLPQQWSAIAQGSSQSKTEQLLLRPGQNSLTLYLDQSGQLDELNKTNNQTRLQVILNGTCQPQYQPQQPVRQQQPYQHQLPQRQQPRMPSPQP
jgi:hypothetical protein